MNSLLVSGFLTAVCLFWLLQSLFGLVYLVRGYGHMEHRASESKWIFPYGWDMVSPKKANVISRLKLLLVSVFGIVFSIVMLRLIWQI